MSSPSKVTCPYCPGSPKLYVVPRGLNVHITKVHRDVASQDRNTLGVPGPSASAQMPTNNSSSSSRVASTSAPQVCLDTLGELKGKVNVLKHIPKGARCLVAGKLCEVIDRCIRSNAVEDWFTLLTFSFSVLRVPEKGTKSLTSKVKENVDCTALFFPENTSRKSRSLVQNIESKVHDGDLRGAVRLLLSDSSLAPTNEETVTSLREKHPAPSRPLVVPPAPEVPVDPITVTVPEVKEAIAGFYNGSAAGLDGLRPQHLKELTSCTSGSNGPRLLESLTKLCNFLLRGSLNSIICPYMYGASLCALAKKDGGIRPIAVGCTIRRLAAKLCCRAVRDRMATYFRPVQIGFGTARGCEAAIHATRAYALANEGSDAVILKVDIKNAFNSVERDVILNEVANQVPSLFPFLHQCYSTPSNLLFNGTTISSQVGAQQGDPLGPLIFCLAIQKVVSSLDSPLNVWYLDDGTIGGSPETVLNDLHKLVPALREIGLEVNPAKCELFCCDSSVGVRTDFEEVLPGLRYLQKSSLCLLGAPIFPEGVGAALEDKRLALVRAKEHLGNLSAHVALILLRNCFAAPRIMYILRTAPTWLFQSEVAALDETIKGCLNPS
ncbi:uncharacterized protein LOC125228717 [Leguminivora glycinivorella]|uniref:uncharacterized protein LOC125228717 n=1 Tax=Leguminivora glycinivorella TaxID=1035111 RepID=UPI00200F715A|nr:uncharacterized protein LOC125228717 [Leguminivora glycinivorella]